MRRLPLLLTVLLALASAPARAYQPGMSPLACAVNDQVRAALRVAPNLAVHVAELESGEEVYSYRADELKIVASNTKLVTSAAALDALGPGYLFETRVLARGAVADGVLAGDLAVIGGGDPNLSGRHHFGDPFAVFRRWAAALKARGVARVAGEVFLVNGLFDPARIHPDWPKDQLSKWYEAPVESLSFNDNCVLVRVWPGSRPGRRARVELVPELPLFGIENTTRTTASRRHHVVHIGRRPGSNVLTVSGAMYLHSRRPVESWVTVEDPAQFFGSALVAALAQEGVEVAGGARPLDRLTGSDWQEVAIHRSDLLTTLEVINKRSQNFYAESLVKLLGALRCGEGSWQRGVQAATEFLAGFGIEPGAFRMADGSGMSRNNRFTARQLTTLLRHMARHRWGREFILSLPHSGEAGLRWEDRLAKPPYAGNVLAKTGTLSGVSTISGYAKAVSGKVYVFSILGNGVRSNWQAVRAQDRILKALIDHG